MSQQELLISVLGILRAHGIPYMLTGSIVSSMQGEPRQSHDIDMVLQLHPRWVHPLAEAISAKGWHVHEESIREAIRTGGMFNMIDITEGDKVDFWMLTDEPFDASRFSRRREVTMLGTTAMVSSPEDTILAKLRWAKLSGGSAKQLTDATRIYEVQHALLDLNYVHSWVTRMGLGAEWDTLIRNAEIPV